MGRINVLPQRKGLFYMSLKKKIAIVLVMLFAISCGAGAAVYWLMSRPPGFSDKTRGEIVKLMVDSMRANKSPGMLLGVWIPDRGEFICSKGFGDLKTKDMIKDTDRFRIGSITKTFTATVILQLVDEGKLKLSDKLSKFYPKIPNSNKISIRQLLDMTSGIHSYTEVPWLERRFMKDRFASYSPNELVWIGLSRGPDFPPGKGYHYSNTNYVILGMIIEKITENDLESEIGRRIIDRLSLKGTSFPKGVSKLSGRHVRGYMFKDGKYEDWTVQNISWGWAAGAMVSDLYDLKTYITAMSDGKLVSKKMQLQRLNYWVDMKMKKAPTLKYGLGAFTMGGFVGHNGGLPGYSDLAMYDPETGAVVVFMQNIEAEEGMSSLEIFQKLLKILYPNRKV